MRKKIDDYLAEARSWDDDKEAMRDSLVKRSVTISWLFGLAWVLTLVALLVVVSKYKQPDAALFRVDSSTGIVDKVDVLTDGKATYGDKIDEYFIARYVQYRESYSMAFGKEYYDNVGLMSGPDEQARYSSYMSMDNPKSPINVLKDTGKVRVSIKNFSKINAQTYLVRYYKEVNFGSGRGSEISHWVATIVYSYSSAPMNERDRQINPLGFLVSEYRNNPESADVKKVSP